MLFCHMCAKASTAETALGVAFDTDSLSHFSLISGPFIECLLQCTLFLQDTVVCLPVVQLARLVLL